MILRRYASLSFATMYQVSMVEKHFRSVNSYVPPLNDLENGFSVSLQVAMGARRTNVQSVSKTP